MADDISSLGIGIRLQRTVVTALAQGGSILTPGDVVTLHLNQQPHANDAVAVVSARVRHVRRLSLEDYVVGFRFNEPELLDDGLVQRLVQVSD